MDLNEIKRVGLGAAFKSGEVLKHYFGNIREINKKSAKDLVTNADTESEKVIIDTIRSAFPQHSILAEESGLNSVSSNQFQWIVDPLDGTVNFAHQLGLFCVSIAFAIGESVKVGIVLNPVSGELFAAVEGQGATLNGRPIQVSSQSDLAESLLVTGFPYNINDIIAPAMERFTNCLRISRGVRRLGSAAIDLCYVACGRFEAFWEQNLHPWDTAAGLLIVKEAGGTITDFSNNTYSVFSKEMLASNGKVHQAMLAMMSL
jgi:myo-inositol-1(or 4)-monophosphatase